MTYDPHIVGALSDQIKPILRGHDPSIQGAVLAELLALWLVGHTGSDKDTVDQMREGLLHLHIEMVRDLISISDQEIMTNIPPAGRA